MASYYRTSLQIQTHSYCHTPLQGNSSPWSKQIVPKNPSLYRLASFASELTRDNNTPFLLLVPLRKELLLPRPTLKSELSTSKPLNLLVFGASTLYSLLSPPFCRLSRPLKPTFPFTLAPLTKNSLS
ncbi:hypothetical protein V8G54_002769 [Vigna mungo]|uniref:Uncharacterized protein n=1 Tax=Vigna mungo TaxID=3915 RepID=A0AAQ3P9D6_VIGMU